MEGNTPAFPDHVAAGRNLSDGDKHDIAERAWSQSHGSSVAFEQLCGEYARGELRREDAGAEAIEEMPSEHRAIAASAISMHLPTAWGSAVEKWMRQHFTQGVQWEQDLRNRLTSLRDTLASEFSNVLGRVAAPVRDAPDVAVGTAAQRSEGGFTGGTGGQDSLSTGGQATVAGAQTEILPGAAGPPHGPSAEERARQEEEQREQQTQRAAQPANGGVTIRAGETTSAVHSGGGVTSGA